VLRNQVGMFQDFKVEWVPGATPTAYLYDADKNVVSEFVVGDKDLQEVLQVFKDNGFVPSRKQADLGAPTLTTSFGGHHYLVFNTPTFFDAAVEAAKSKVHDGEPGYLLTVTSAQENKFIEKILTENNIGTVWLGAQDHENEGSWTWITGPEEDSVFTVGHSNEAFANWRDGEPNNADNEDCAVIMSDGAWNDAKCDSDSYSVIVEFGSQTLEEPTNEVHADL